MSGSKIGGLKAKEANKLRHGEDFYKKIGAKGGAAGRGHKFAHGKLDPRVMGTIGGSARNYKKGFGTTKAKA